MTIPLVDLNRQYEEIKDEVKEAMTRIMESSAFILGEEVRQFENEFASFCGSRYAIGVSSGTAALHLALLAAGVEKGDEVITVPYTFTATVEVISYVGAKVVFVDINPEDYNIDVSCIEEKITKKTKAILLVHIYGHPVDLEPILALADKYGLKVIEDAAQAHGAEYRGKKVSVLGTVGCFSFYPGKNLGAYGDGGIVVTNDREIANKVKLLRNHGQREKYEHIVEGFNYRLDALQAAILRVKLTRLSSWNKNRRQHAKLYNELLAGMEVITPVEREYAKHVYHLYVVRTKDRNGLQEWLQSQGIATGTHYSLPLHLQKAYEHLGYKKGDFPVAEKCSQEVISLPMFPELTREEIEEVCGAVKSFLSNPSLSSP
ncbi:MAG: DegT/DnrJ/EryC1/StrS family aminotransferase [Nitrospirae bacterium]|nr:DegT/DnrJ/EryC1/StrS family aminotransferase [Nitrospirota bacterium]